MKTFSLLAMIAMVLFLGCKKEEDEKDRVANTYLGGWTANDSVYYGGASASPENYPFIVRKKQDDTLYFFDFLGADTCIFVVTDTSLLPVSSTDIPSGMFKNFSGIRSGDTLRYDLGLGHNIFFARWGVAVKN